MSLVYLIGKNAFSETKDWNKHAVNNISRIEELVQFKRAKIFCKHSWKRTKQTGMNIVRKKKKSNTLYSGLAVWETNNSLPHMKGESIKQNTIALFREHFNSVPTSEQSSTNDIRFRKRVPLQTQWNATRISGFIVLTSVSLWSQPPSRIKVRARLDWLSRHLALLSHNWISFVFEMS